MLVVGALLCICANIAVATVSECRRSPPLLWLGLSSRFHLQLAHALLACWHGLANATARQVHADSCIVLYYHSPELVIAYRVCAVHPRPMCLVGCTRDGLFATMQPILGSLLGQGGS
jgi:hypothetical protein